MDQELEDRLHRLNNIMTLLQVVRAKLDRMVVEMESMMKRVTDELNKYKE